MKYIWIDENDIVIGAGSGPVLPGGATPVQSNIPIGKLAQMMVVDGELQPRPVSPVPTVDDGQLTFAALVQGTEIEIVNVTADTIATQLVADTDNWSDTITLTESGQYRIEVHAPSPHLHSTTLVEIS